jgi:hypothetical protein
MIGQLSRHVGFYLSIQLKRSSVLGDLAFPQCFPSIDTLDLMPTLLIQRV